MVWRDHALVYVTKLRIRMTIKNAQYKMFNIKSLKDSVMRERGLNSGAYGFEKFKIIFSTVFFTLFHLSMLNW